VKKIQKISEDVAYGIYDRPGPTGQIADAEQDEQSTVPDEVPLSPSQHMSNQLSVQRPPIEDEDYVPASVEELSRAATAISQLVPSNSVEFFYKRLHQVLDDATDNAAQEQIPHDSRLGVDSGEEVAVTEEGIRNELKTMLLEMLTSDDLKDYEEFRAGYSTISPGEEEMTPPEQATSGEMSLDDLAKEFGYSGAPGVRQEIERLTNRLEYFATKVKKQDLDGLVTYATGEFIDTLDESGVLDPEDIEDLRSAPGMVKDLDSFRYFFVSAFVMPAYRKVIRDATKNVKTQIQNLGIPKELHQTVFNQVTGASSVKHELIMKKLFALVKSGKLEQDQVEKISDKVNSARSELKAMASDYSDDFVQQSLKKWSGTSKAQRVSLLKQAMESTLQDV
tara:strand:- start:448 stop:1626 length:1179 start_codon:yes stop_codon:yes gene_type:complete